MKNKKKEIELFCSQVNKLIQRECWSVIAGEGSGSHVSIDFGEKLGRNKPLSNPNIPEISRKYYGEFSIYIEECAWRLESIETIICGSLSPNDNNGIIINGLNRLVGKKVEDVNIIRPALDLEIIFEDSLKLILFCNTLTIEDGDNYTLFFPERVYSVQGYGVLDMQERQRIAKLKSV